MKPHLNFPHLKGRREPVRPGDRQTDKTPPLSCNETTFLLTLCCCSALCRTKQIQATVLHPRLASSGKYKGFLLVWQSSWTTDPAGKGALCAQHFAKNGSWWDWMLGGKNILSPSSHKYFTLDYTQVTM